MIWWFVLFVAPLLPTAVCVFNLLTWRRGKDRLGEPHDLSIAIPARNEGRNIELAIRSALRAEGVGVILREVLVCDDHSEDDTREVVLRMAQKDSRVRLITAPPLPADWLGKVHALQQLLDAATGEYVLFMDADVQLKPQGLHRLCSLLETPLRARVVTAVPEQVVRSFVERLIVPLLTLTYTSWLPLRALESSSDPRAVAANGQLLLVERAALLSKGGFETIRDQIVDDVAFCRKAKRWGWRVVFADGFEMARCRMYRTASEVWRGFSKNLYAGLGSIPVLALAVGLYVICFVLPYLVLVAVVLGLLPQELGPPALAGVLLNIALRSALAVRFSHPLEAPLLHPFAVLGLIAIALNSLWWALAGKTIWAGRRIDVLGSSEKKKRAEPSVLHEKGRA